MVVVGLLVARTYGENIYGQYSLAFSFVGLFGLIFSMGVDTIIVREVARRPASAWDIFSAGLWLRIGLFPLTVMIIKLGAIIAGYDLRQQQLISMVGLIVGLSAVADLPRSLMQGLQRMARDTLCRSVERIGALLAILFTIQYTSSLEAVLLALLIGTGLGVIASWFLLPPLIGPPLLKRGDMGWGLLRMAAPIGGSLIVIQLYLQLPAVILSLFVPKGDYAAVGLYNAANGVVSPFLLLPVALGTALLPVLASSGMTDTSAYRPIHFAIIGCILLCSLPMTLLLIAFASPVLTFLYTAAFQRAASGLAILSMIIPVTSINTYLTYLLIAKNRQRTVLYATLLILGLTVITGPAASALWKVEGAAFARVIASLGGMVYMLYITTRPAMFSSSADKVQSQVT